MTEVQTDWKNAPEGATHYTIKESGAIWFKNINGFWTIYDSGVWYAIGLPASDLIPRPTSTAIPELKKLTQAVFDGLPPEYQWAAVCPGADAWVFEREPKPFDSEFTEWNHSHGVKFKFLGEGYDATNWQDSKIEREPSVAEILEAFAANPPNFDALINSVANAQTLAEAQAEIELLRAEVDNRKVAHEATADSFARILAALDHASPASIVHHLNGEGACLQMINDMRYRIERVTAEIERLKAGHDRYEIVRKLNVVQFQKLYTATLKGCVTFDQMVDLYGEFFDEN